MAGQIAKRYRRGTHRSVPPEETWQLVAPLLRAYGITRVADVTGLDVIGIPVFQAIRPRSRSLSVSQGKGVTPILARVSAVMEAIELHHAEQVPAGRRQTWREVRERGLLTYRPEDLQATRRSLLSLAGPDLVFEWLPGRTLVTGRPTMVPADWARLDGRVRREWTHHPFATSTNGLASGNSTAEAALHALYEVIERDAVARLTTLPRAERPRLELSSVDDPDCAELLDRFGAAGVSVTAFDATWPHGEGGTGVPCYHVSVWSPDLPVVVPGSGCHGAPEVALARALTEAAQGRLTVISGSRDDLSDRLYALQADPAKGAPRPAPSLRTVPFRRRETGHDLADELRTVAAGVTALTGTEPVLVELGRPAAGPAVVKVLAPGLGFYARDAVARELSHA
ncbi:YcaO-like family protein [Streptomyces sp. NPDC020845]|uniref:YcaO-like family protein n=1 Tax=Streptomyces sp. NPDC020845 TaxID=3365096 RepID=UPI003797407A